MDYKFDVKAMDMKLHNCIQQNLTTIQSQLLEVSNSNQTSINHTIYFSGFSDKLTTAMILEEVGRTLQQKGFKINCFRDINTSDQMMNISWE